MGLDLVRAPNIMIQKPPSKRESFQEPVDPCGLTWILITDLIFYSELTEALRLIKEVSKIQIYSCPKGISMKYNPSH
ncbi:hypothetical protein AYI69_g4384 [Smittium culicis]|uniref:Uncharacterized protein n=1 Tax=Smittium culicis TaxID=133412 RepID=A0A1R1YE19_9FUNG|nr:hypothetical protein AYI69_g4384 [Smittium culicis]